jgi:UDP-N-acetyl-D-glucosamine dehydrogenase
MTKNTMSTKTQDPRLQLADKLRTRTAKVAIVGLGYVGLPLARAMHQAGFKVIGFDKDKSKVDKLGRGETYLHHLGEDLVESLAKSDRFTPTSDEDQLREADAIILCVPTPLGRHMEPDMSFIMSCAKMCARTLRPGQLIALESTTYPYTTRGDVLPVLEKTGLTCGKDFFLAFSPEREDPGRKGFDTQTIPKLVGGVDQASGELAHALYSAAVKQAILVDSAEIAEAAKLLENIYRCVNIALVNELKPVLAAMNIDIWKVIEAAATKPFGFQAFYPGPGLGGHCIPIDPFYLTWKAKEFGHHTRFIELAGEVNNGMPRYVVSRTMEALNKVGRPLKGAKVLVVGITYKPDIDDVRETPATEIIHLLGEGGAEVQYHDPHVPTFPSMRKWNFKMSSIALTEESVRLYDVVVIVTNHKVIDYELLAREARIIVDSRNAMAKCKKIEGILVKA